MTPSFNSAKRRYRPGLEGLEVRRLRSAGLSFVGPEALARPIPSAASGAQFAQLRTCGTGKGIVIITQGETGSQARHTA